MSPCNSSGLPGNDAGHTNVPLFGLAPDGVYPAIAVTSHAVRSYHTISPLPLARRYIFCGTFRRLTSPRRYLASCPAEPGLSSPGGDCPADSVRIVNIIQIDRQVLFHCRRPFLPDPGFSCNFNPVLYSTFLLTPETCETMAAAFFSGNSASSNMSMLSRSRSIRPVSFSAP